MDDLQPVIERLRKAQEEEDRQERDCLAELRGLGLLEAGFGARTRRQWSDEVRAVLFRHGYKIGRTTMRRKKDSPPRPVGFYQPAPTFAEKVPVDVRARLANTPIRGGKGLRPGECYAQFWLQPQVLCAGRWQGGESIQVRRDGENEFKIGCLDVMTLEQAAQYIEKLLDRYNWPYFGREPWEHPFIYNI